MNSCILEKYWEKIGNGRRNVECVNSGRMIVVNIQPVGSKEHLLKEAKLSSYKSGFYRLLNGNEVDMLRES